MNGVALQSLGCRVNRADLDTTATELIRAGIPLVDAKEADVVVINTCAVTSEAEAKCRHAVRRALSLPQAPWVVVSGCSARISASMIEQLSERICVVPEREGIAAKVTELMGVPAVHIEADPQADAVASSLTPTGRTRPLVKIQDGCDLRCTYCIVWKARGASRSLAPEAVVEEVRQAVARGAGEVVLTGINIGCYEAKTDTGTLRLPGLMRKLLDETDVGRLRVSSIEPQDVDEDLIDTIASSEGRIAPYLHMCLQSGSDSVLARMGRVYTAAEYAERVRMAKSRVENMAISTDVIVAFPGERVSDFKETAALCESLELAWLHVFRYSPRPGTPAASWPQIDTFHSYARAEYMRELSNRLRAREAERCVGRVERVLAQGTHPGVSGGLLNVRLEGEAKEGKLVDALVTATTSDGVLKARVL